MSDKIFIETVPNIPYVGYDADIAQLIADATEPSGLEDGDILCIASKAVSTAEGRTVSLQDIQAGILAQKIHADLPRKDSRTLQIIINQTQAPDGSRVEVRPNFIGAWLPNGLFLTSGGVDKIDSQNVMLLPKDPDGSAAAIGRKLRVLTGAKVGVVITDSDGRVDKKGATQVAIGVYGIPALRRSQVQLDNGEIKQNEETLCDMLAAAAALLMGQRGVNKPVVRIRGLEFTFDETSTINDAINGNILKTFGSVR